VVARDADAPRAVEGARDPAAQEEEEVVLRPLQQLSLTELRTRTSVKWRRYPEDVLPLWVAEMDVPLAEPVVAAVGAALRRGDTGYAYGSAYAEALAELAWGRWGWPIASRRTRLVPDVMLGIVEVLRLVTRPGDGVVINPPVYPPFYAFVAHAGLVPVDAPLGADGRLDPDALERTFAREDVTAYLLCNPHNPTGTVHTADELRTVARLADTHGVRVVADEIHAPLVLEGASFVPYLALDEAQRGFSVLSASKAWNLAGLKAAVAVAGEEAAVDLERMPEEVGHGASHVAAIAHVAALRDGGPWLDGLLADLADNRRLLGALLREQLPEVRWRPGEGTYLAWLDCRGTGLGDDPARVFLERGRVALQSGGPFGAGGAGFARLNLATTPTILREAVERMASAFAG
jgi:cysteine-S-conjugate beta-lyase